MTSERVVTVWIAIVEIVVKECKNTLGRVVEILGIFFMVGGTEFTKFVLVNEEKMVK